MNQNNNHNKSSRGWQDSSRNERHYCAFCNVWMASDRASVLVHQNGKKHAEKQLAAQSQKALEMAAQEKQQSALQKTLRHMEEAAAAAVPHDYGLFGAGAAYDPATAISFPAVANNMHVPSMVPPPPPPPMQQAPPQPMNPTSPGSALVAKQKKREWDARKHQRDQEKKKQKLNPDDDDDNGRRDSAAAKQWRTKKLSSTEGFYQSVEDDGAHTWLEGVAFRGILEADLPVQVWLGSAGATTPNELRLPENQRHWRDALVVAIRTRHSAERCADRMVVDVAYLSKTTTTTANSSNNTATTGTDEEEETVEQIAKSVPLMHIRILLGNEMASDRIPKTLEEARLLAMGGEEITTVAAAATTTPGDTSDSLKIDESTGFSGWTTLKIKRTTVLTEQKAERESLRQKRKDAILKAELDAKQAEARRMEEAKVSNSNDSALGAYDVWNRTKDGYKGVDIHDATATQTGGTDATVHDYGKKLATSSSDVVFKKGTAKRKQSRRTTSADDDE